MRVRFLQRKQYGATVYRPGDVVDMHASTASVLLRRKVVEPVAPAAVEAGAESAPAADALSRDEIKARLDELDIEYSGRARTETLRDLLAEATA